MGQRPTASRDDAPLVFIHYGDSPYLVKTLASARIFNPGKRIVLLGDHRNRSYQRLGIEHRPFAEFDAGPEHERFRRVYQFVAGREHGNPEWTRFVFERWFHLCAFVASEGYERFWTFDSDTLVLTALDAHERGLEGYDCTEQCEALCMNGYIGNLDVVRGYLRTINDLFEDEAYLDAQRAEFELEPGFAFTEMRAYTEYRDRASVRSLNLAEVRDGGMFDDCIACSSGQFELADGAKRLYFRDGGAYVRSVVTGELVRLHSANMSWASPALLDELFRYTTQSEIQRLAAVAASVRRTYRSGSRLDAARSPRGLARARRLTFAAIAALGIGVPGAVGPAAPSALDAPFEADTDADPDR